MAVKELTQSAQAAKEIRKILKKAYPTIKFSVRSRNFSMGDAVDVSWNLGPMTEKVEALISHFQYGHFDGMTDYYENSNDIEGLPQAKYVHAQRNYYTPEEIENHKIKFGSPEYKDLYRAGETFNHMVGKDLCKLIGIEYQGMNQIIADADCFNGAGHRDRKTLQDCVWAIVRTNDMLEGYKGLEHATNDMGQEIKNSFRAIQ